MLTFTWKDVLVAEQRQMDLVEQAEQARKIAPQMKGNIRSEWMFALGEKLVSWGCQLQARYREVLPQKNLASLCDNTMVSKAVRGHI